MIAKQVRNLLGAGCFAAALALTWAGAGLPNAVVPAPAAVACPSLQTEPPALTATPKVTPKVTPPAVPVDQPPATVQNLRRADRP
jgi:hypothetical protein